jgi:hypothetical protein
VLVTASKRSVKYAFAAKVVGAPVTVPPLLVMASVVTAWVQFTLMVCWSAAVVAEGRTIVPFA